MINRIKDWLNIETKGQLASSPPDLLSLFGAQPTQSAINVNPITALKCPVWYAVTKVISESVAQLPLHLYRRTKDGGKERATDHPLYSVLHDRANPWTSAFDFRLFAQSQLCGYGNSLTVINRVGGRVEELIPVPWSAVKVAIDEATMEPSYSITTTAGQERPYPRADVLHVRTLGTDPIVGLSPVEQAKEAIGIMLAMEGYMARLFGKGGRPSGILKIPGKLNPDLIKRLRDSFSKIYGGSESGGVATLESGLDFTPLQFTSVDMQFMELRRQQIAELCRVLRVPLSLVAELERTTHSNAEHMGRQFLSFTLLPWLTCWEQAMHRSLLTPSEQGEYVIEFLVDDLVRADLAARMDALSKAVTNGILSPNEARAGENRPPYSGGNEFRLPMNTEQPGQTEATADGA